mmetsp:Transcript_4087/g.5422  ORF Transcript_4087/g.5422 Transcript_4087/m.5422 type:complete len:97 (-) Transcript_4087:2715-3005(-)
MMNSADSLSLSQREGLAAELGISASDLTLEPKEKDRQQTITVKSPSLRTSVPLVRSKDVVVARGMLLRKSTQPIFDQSTMMEQTFDTSSAGLQIRR